MSDQISQELSGVYSESAFLGVESDLIFLEAVERLPQVLQVVDISETLHKHVIDVHLHGTSDLLLENLVGHPLESCSYVLQSERHHHVAVDPSVGDEHHLVFVLGMHLDLVVPGVGVHEAY